jgi:subtilase family serine protease
MNNPYYRSFPFLTNTRPTLFSSSNNLNTVKAAYNIPTLVPTKGVKNATISIIVAYSYPNLLADFTIFCKRFGLPTPRPNQINVINLNTSKKAPAVNQNITGWFMESCLDLQWAYAVNPNATINVVQGVSDGFRDLMNAIQFVNNNTSSDIVSMSWGCNDFQSELLYTSYFNKPTTCYLASSGDSAALVNFPSCLTNVLSCGGTSLDFTKNVRTEKCWSDAGCGTSQYVNKPIYQGKITTLNNLNKRCTPDICALADPITGVFICFQNQFNQIGGTSLSCPLIASILSISVQDRINKKKSSLTTVSNNGSSLQIQNALYSLYNSPNSKNYLNDITLGTDGNYNTQSGFDIPTGLGSLNAGNLIAYLSTL